MDEAYEILHVLGGRVFDAESYELTAALGEVFAEREPGYYLTRPGLQAPDRSADAVLGPFADLHDARAAAGDLGRTSGNDLH